MSVWDAMLDSWPSKVVARAQVGMFTGGLYTPRTLANLDSLGKGPAGKLLVGGKVVYPVASLVQWLNSRSKGLN